MNIENEIVQPLSNVVTSYQFEQPVLNSYNHAKTYTKLYNGVQFGISFCVVVRVENRLLKLVRGYNL